MPFLRMFVLLLVCSPSSPADVAFDDSYAKSVCGGPTQPEDPVIVTLCLEMMGTQLLTPHNLMT